MPVFLRGFTVAEKEGLAGRSGGLPLDATVAALRRENRNLREQLRYGRKQAEKRQKLSAKRVRSILRLHMAYLETFANEFLFQHRNHLSENLRLLRVQRLVTLHLGDGVRPGKLGKHLDTLFGGAFSRLRQDIPSLTPREMLLFSCLTAGFGTEMLRNLLGCDSDATVYMLKHRLKRKIQASRSAEKEAWLSLMARDGWRPGADLLSLCEIC